MTTPVCAVCHHPIWAGELVVQQGGPHQRCDATTGHTRGRSLRSDRALTPVHARQIVVVVLVGK